MNVFLSWSGEESRNVAEQLAKFLPSVLPNVRTFMSARDIVSGEVWSRALQGNLRTADVGIICLTRKNCHEPWILFEAGALACKEKPVISYLINVTTANLPEPLLEFQACDGDKFGTQKLLTDLRNLSGGSFAEKSFDTLVDAGWALLSECIHDTRFCSKIPCQLHHINIPVTSLNEAMKFYHDELGLRKISRPDFAFPGAWLEIGDGRTIHLVVKSLEEGTFRKTLLNGNYENKNFVAGDVHFALRVENVQEMAAYLKKLGRPVYPGLNVHNVYPQIYTLDPDNHIIEFNNKGNPPFE